VVIPTRDRVRDLDELLHTILAQTHLPFEVIVVDDSPIGSAKEVAKSLSRTFAAVGSKLRYMKADGDGLAAARNLGTQSACGDAIFFLDDDTLLLDRNVIDSVAVFLASNPGALGVQTEIREEISGSLSRFRSAISKVFMLTYFEKNKLQVRRSGQSILPSNLTRVVLSQRLSGCSCYRRQVFEELQFDTNLKRWSFMEDLDFSYRLCKSFPRSLYAIPSAWILHKESAKSRLTAELALHMRTIYWSYVFFKDIFEGSMQNLCAFLWALVGNIVAVIGAHALESKTTRECWDLIYLTSSYLLVLMHLGEIMRGDLRFFNSILFLPERSVEANVRGPSDGQISDR